VIKLVISNQRGGVAKTTTTATLARILAERGHRILAVDADPQGSLGLVLGLKPVRYFHDFALGHSSLEDCVVRAAPRVDVLCGSRETSKLDAAWSGAKDPQYSLAMRFGSAADQYDVVLFDTAPSVSLVQTCALVYAGRVLIPVAMDMLSLQGAVACCETGRLLGEIFRADVEAVALLPVMVDRRFQLTAYVMQALEEMAERFHVPLLTPIRTDGTVPRAERAKQFLADYDHSSKALDDYHRAADQLLELPAMRQDADWQREAIPA